MIAVDIPNRPFATEGFTGLMLPDGIFESTIGNQTLNAGLRNVGSTDFGSLQVYVESVSNPGIVVTAQTQTIELPAGASRTLSWAIDVSAAPPGEHYVSFVARRGSDSQRVIKKIFVTRVSFNPATATFSAETPQGTFHVQFHDFAKPGEPCCSPTLKHDFDPRDRKRNFLELVASEYKGHDPNFVFCPPGYLPHSLDATLVPVPTYTGQYGDLPFEDPWWKIILCIIAVLLLVAAGIAAAIGGGEVSVTGGASDDTGSPVPDCCHVRASGGSSNYVAAGLVAAAAAVATAAAFSDDRDPFRRGQDNTPPASASERTIGEGLKARIDYIDPIRPGTAFAIGTKWTYTRTTDAATYTYEVEETNRNVHVVSHYEIDAPNVIRVYQREHFIVKAQFFGPDDKPFSGGELFVQCILAGPSGQYRRFILQDDGVAPDDATNDGTYSGVYDFYREKPDPRGFWHFYVIAQDVNDADPSLPPEQAAKTIGGMVLTHQVTIDYQGGTCPLVPDGDVHVI